MTDRPTILKCSHAQLRYPHGAHDWEPQPGMTPVHCPGYGDPVAADRPTLEDLDAEPEPARWCCSGNGEDCPLCRGTNLPYPFLCPGHPDTPENRQRVQEATATPAADAQREERRTALRLLLTRAGRDGLAAWKRRAEKAERATNLLADAQRRAEEAEAALNRVRALAAQLEECAENARKESDRRLYAAIARDLRTRIGDAEPAPALAESVSPDEPGLVPAALIDAIRADEARREQHAAAIEAMLDQPKETP